VELDAFAGAVAYGVVLEDRHAHRVDAGVVVRLRRVAQDAEVAIGAARRQQQGGERQQREAARETHDGSHSASSTKPGPPSPPVATGGLDRDLSVDCPAAAAARAPSPAYTAAGQVPSRAGASPAAAPPAAAAPCPALSPGRAPARCARPSPPPRRGVREC